MVKKCKDCLEVKDINDFAVRTYTPNGRASYCRRCMSIRQSRSYARKRQKYIERALKWNKENRDGKKRQF